MITFDGIIHYVQNNAVFSGMVGAGLVGAVLMQFRSIPNRIIGLIEQQFILTLTVHGDERVFENLNDWVASREETKKSRRLSVANIYDEDEDKFTYVLSMGEGGHIFRFNKRFYWLRRKIEKIGDNDSPGRAVRMEILTIKTFGRNPRAMEEIVEECQINPRERESVKVFFGGGGRGYANHIYRAKRPMKTIYLPQDQKERLTDAIENFLARRKWYAERGIPWRLGIMLQGMPGTGKSSLIFALASRFGKSIHIINPADLDSDAELMSAMRSANGAFVVIEDIDSCAEALAREEKEKGSKTGITLSGLLNAIDGVAAQEGRVLFITTNHPHLLDKALLRPGRIDISEELFPAGLAVATQMFHGLGVEGNVDDFLHSVVDRLPMPQSTLQNIILGRENPPEETMEQLCNEQLTNITPLVANTASLNTR